MYRPVPKTTPRYAWSISGWVTSWHEKVSAARQSLAEAEKKLSTASSPTEQTLAFVNWNAKKHELQRILSSRT